MILEQHYGSRLKIKTTDNYVRIMKKINLLYFYHSGANCQYFETMLKLLEGRDDFSYRTVRPNEVDQVNLNDYDILVYQTFPDYLNRKKFNSVSIAGLDNTIWHLFPGFRILLDSFDMGDYNGYERFGTAWPRIKHVPSYEYLKKFEVVSTICTTGWQQKKFSDIPLELKRNIPVHCAFTIGGYPHNIREVVMKKLSDDFSGYTSFERIPVHDYNEFLRRVQISVVATGFGETSGSAYPALQSGALLFVYEKIKEVKLLPFADLVDGVDYVSFNMNNFGEKLDWILVNEKNRNKIRLSGQKKFFEGFDSDRSAKEFLEYLKFNWWGTTEQRA